MRHLAADEHRMQHVGKLQIGHELARPSSSRRSSRRNSERPTYPLCDIVFHLTILTNLSRRIVSAAAITATTIFW